MVKDLGTLAKSRPTTLDEKRRIERELGLQVEPTIVMPKSNRSDGPHVTIGRRIAKWLKGAPQ